jgi:DNA polymerase I-like protein with 3'-5' exonuclease and polymerase domains
MKDAWADNDGSLWDPAGIVPVKRYLSGPRNGEYKTKKVSVPGELKVKFQDFYYTFPGHTKPDEGWATATTDGYGAPLYSTSGDVMDELAVRDIPFLKLYTRKAALDKEIGTYYVRQDPTKGLVGMLTCVQPHDHMLHHKLNHTSTVTSRLSSSDPNLQNLPRGDKSKVKQMFVSRFGDEGCMLEVDYSQLEVVVQGVLTGDENLCADLRARVDFHCKRVAKKHGITYEEALELCKNEDGPDFKKWKSERTLCKIFSFQRAYGAGAAKISVETGIPLQDVKDMIVAEDEMFPGITAFNADVETAVKKSAAPFAAVGTDGVWKKYRRGFWQAPTGTRYSFRSYDPPEYAAKRGATDTFMPTELKNYPIQGTGGEFVQGVAMGVLWRQFIQTDYYGGLAYLVNTVHDCVWADTHHSVRDQVAKDMYRIMQTIPDFYNNRHGMNIQVPFPVEVETGSNMYDLKHMHIENTDT